MQERLMKALASKDVSAGYPYFEQARWVINYLRFVTTKLYAT